MEQPSGRIVTEHYDLSFTTSLTKRLLVGTALVELMLFLFSFRVRILPDELKRTYGSLLA
jgi:hypothetical protein